jgi:outer membrane receptor protein involved in Fe transport
MKVSRSARGLAGLLMAGTALGAAGTAMADQADANTTVSEVVVTANKRAENIQLVPSSVTAVGEQLIDRVQAHNLNDLVAYVPGLNVQPSGVDANRLVIRGLTTGPNDLSPTVGVYIDDAPFGSNIGLALGALFSPDIDPFDLERVEVLRGPQGTLYGASTLAGLVKYVTKQPDASRYDAHVRADVNYADDSGTFGETLGGGVNIPIVEDKAALRISGNYLHNDGDTTNVRTGESGLNSLTKYNGRADLMLKPTDNLTIDAIVIAAHSEAPHIQSITGDPHTLEPIYDQYSGYGLVDGFAKSSYVILEGNIRYQFANGISLTSSTSYSHFSVKELADDTEVFQPAFGALGSLFSFSGPVEPRTNKFTQEIRIASPANEHFEWLAGAFYDNEDSHYLSGINSHYLFGTPPPALAPTVAALANYETVDGHPTYKEIAGFGNATYYITPQFDVTAGVRYSHNDQTSTNAATGYLVAIGVLQPFRSSESSDNVWTESFAVRWRITPDTMLYARAANGYRPGGSTSSSSTFDPDTTWNYEAGIKTSALDGRLTADFAAFYIDWSNVQLNFFNGTNTVIGNAGDAKSQGFEAEATYIPIDGLTFAANLAYTDAQITALIPGATGGAVPGDELPFNSKWAGALRADYAFPLSSTFEGNVGASLRYKSAFNTTFPGDTGTRFYRLPSQTYIDLRAGISTGRYSANLQVLNVGNERNLIGAAEFFGVPQAAADAAGQPVNLTYAPGRTWGLSLSARF